MGNLHTIGIAYCIIGIIIGITLATVIMYMIHSNITDKVTSVMCLMLFHLILFAIVYIVTLNLLSIKVIGFISVASLCLLTSGVTFGYNLKTKGYGI